MVKMLEMSKICGDDRAIEMMDDGSEDDGEMMMMMGRGRCRTKGVYHLGGANRVNSAGA